MRIDISQRIGVCYKDENWAKEVLEQIYSQTPKNMIHSRKKYRIEFIDGSYVVAFSAKDLNTRGRALDRIFVQEGVDEEFVNEHLRPCIKRHAILKEIIVPSTGEVYFW